MYVLGEAGRVNLLVDLEFRISVEAPFFVVLGMHKTPQTAKIETKPIKINEGGHSAAQTTTTTAIE